MAPRRLSDRDKDQIVQLYQQKGTTLATLAEQFGVSASTIGRVVRQAPEATAGTSTAVQQASRSAVADHGLAAPVKHTRRRPRSTAAGPVLAEAAPLVALTVDDATGAADQDAEADGDDGRGGRRSDGRSSRGRRRRSSKPTGTKDRGKRDTAPELKADAATEDDAASDDRDSPPAASAEKRHPAKPRLRSQREREDAAGDAELDAPEDTPDNTPDNTHRDSTAQDRDREDDAFDDADLELDDDDDFDDDFDDEDDDDDGDDAIPSSVRANSTEPIEIYPLADASIPTPCYLVVDRAANLVVRPLKEFRELGMIPADEADSNTLPVFDNHRVARRFSGRTQRVIKVPDSSIFAKTTVHLQAKDIQRLLIDGQVYAL